MGTIKASVLLASISVVGPATKGAHPKDMPQKQPIPSALLADKNYEHGTQLVHDTDEPHSVTRYALTSQHDQNGSVVLAGPITNMLAGWSRGIIMPTKRNGKRALPASGVEADFAWSQAHLSYTNAAAQCLHRRPRSPALV